MRGEIMARKDNQLVIARRSHPSIEDWCLTNLTPGSWYTVRIKGPDIDRWWLLPGTNLPNHEERELYIFNDDENLAHFIYVWGFWD